MKKIFLFCLLLLFVKLVNGQGTIYTNFVIEKTTPSLHLKGSGGIINFNSSDITLIHSLNTLTLGGGNFDIGANSITGTGSLFTTASRGTKGWFTNLEITNLPTINGTSIHTSPTFLTSVTLPASVILPSGTILNFNSSDVTLTHSANTLTLAGGNLNLGANSLLLTGSIGATGSRVTKLWATDGEFTNNLTVSGIAIFNNPVFGLTTTATAGGTTILTASSTYYQVFTGTLAQTVQMPVVSTLTVGHQFYISNLSTGVVTVTSSGGNTICTMAGGTEVRLNCILITGTTAASWDFYYNATFVTNSKRLYVSNSLILAGTDATTMTFPTTSATIARTDAANTFTGHQTIEGVTSTGATGTGNLVFSASPTFTGTIAGITSTMVGLGNVTNESKATMFTSPTFTGTVTIPSPFTLDATSVTAIGDDINILTGLSGTISTTELGYSDGLTDYIQAQIDDTIPARGYINQLSDTSLYFAPVIGIGNPNDTTLFSHLDVIWGCKWDGSYSLVLTKVNGVVYGTTPDIDIALWSDVNFRDATPTEVLSADLTITSTTAGNDATSFASATIAPGTFIWITVEQQTAQPTQCIISIYGHLTE